jgi:tRNA (guanine37-N1)-methyltransferase
VKVDILTLFPNSFSYLQESIIKRAKESGAIDINIYNIRDYSTDKHKTADDRPFGGGPGMLMKFEPIYRAMKALGVYPKKDGVKIVFTSPKGKKWTQSHAEEYSSTVGHLVVLCGHYEGVDQRVIDELVDEEISIGDYVLSGGELPAQIIVDSIVRLIPGVLGNEESPIKETTFENNSIIPEAPQYTRPEVFTTDEGKELRVPEILLSGHHGEIEKWRQERQKASN